jgi:hypothetical protein
MTKTSRHPYQQLALQSSRLLCSALLYFGDEVTYLCCRVRQDFTSGIRSRVNGTPTFYINGVRYDDDSWDEEMLLAAIKQTYANSEHSQPKEKRRRRR